VSDEFLHALESAGHVVRLLPPRQPLPDYLDRYHVLVLGHGSAGSDPADEQRIDGFVAAGGGLILFAGSTDQYQGAASPFLSGVGWVIRENSTLTDPNDPLAFELPETSTLSGYSTMPELKPGAHTVLSWQDGVPLAVRFAYAGGRVVYANDLWAAYRHNWYGDAPYGERFMRNALALLTPRPAWDCNQNGVEDACDVHAGDSADANANGIPDECDVPGDLNCDRAANTADIEPFVLALIDAAAYEREYPHCQLARADANGDGSLNGLDIDPFVDLLRGE
jgi:hypothetical protein